jgi:hypothetical protein
MESFSELLAPFVQGGAIVITALATAVLAWLTYRYVRLNTSMLEEAKASRGPIVYVDLELSGRKIKLVVGNSGVGPAHNIKINVLDSIPWENAENLQGIENLAPIRNGITYLAPNRIFKFEAGWVEWKTLVGVGSSVTFKIRYDDHLGKSHQSEVFIDMDQYSNVLLESFSNAESEIARAIKDANTRSFSHKTLDSISSRMFKKNCPYCRELIAKNATKCPKCYEHLPDNSENDSENTRDRVPAKSQ